MRITTRGRYALRASMALLRLSGGGEPVSINHLSEEEEISPIFLEQIFFKLRKAGIVKSIRGPGGGFAFARAPEKISVKEVLLAAGEELDVTECDKNAKTCDKTGRNCPSHAVWEDVTALLNDYFEKIHLTEVAERGAATGTKNARRRSADR